ncbi:MAG: response regulator [Flavobacteriales bacterium]|jgi:DNA-binding response OmpR family regulator|nr:response regulator [Flavobacteriales bacterium]
MPHVVMIEADALVRKLLEQRLQDAGWTVTALRDAADLVTVLQRAPADLIMLDLAPPAMHGLETIERVRDHGFRTPIMALTTFEQPHLHAVVLGNGGNDLVRKPYDQEQLIARMHRLVAA